MDYFNSNFKDSTSDADSNLPKELEWENMRDGIYGRMDKPAGYNPWKWLSLVLLLIVGGCGTWLALDYFGTEEEPRTAQVESDLSKTKTEGNTTIANASTEKNIDVQSIGNNNKSKNENKTTEQQQKTIDQTAYSQTKLLSPAPVGAPQNVNTSNTSNTSNASNAPSAIMQKPTDVAASPASDIESNAKNKQGSEAAEASPKIIKAPRIVRPESSFNAKAAEQVIVADEAQYAEVRATKEVATLPSKKAQLFATEQQLPVITKQEFTPLVKKKKKNKAKPQFSANLSAGILTSTSLAKGTRNEDYVSSYPGYSINPELQWHAYKNSSVIIGYEYAMVEELFEYEDHRTITVEKPEAVVSQVVNSLVGLVVSENIRDTSTTATQEIKEIKYNKFYAHNLQLSIAQAFQLGKKSKFEVTLGGQLMFNFHGEGRRLFYDGINKPSQVKSFDRDVNVVQPQRDQLAMRFAAKYQYSLGKRSSLFVRVAGAKYLGVWYPNPSLPLQKAQRKNSPLFYGVNLGMNQRF